MKGTWLATTLGDSCDIYQPKTISTKEMVDDGEYPVYGANGVIGRYNQFNHEDSELLITCRGATCGSVNVSEPYSWITGNAMVVRPKDGSINRKFLKYLFLGGIDIAKAITGAAQPQITRTNLAPLEFSYPSLLSEQHRIVAILDEAFEGIAKARANAEQNLSNSRALFESYLNEVFTQRGEGWVDKKIGEIAKHSLGKMLDKVKNKGVLQPYLRNINVRWLSLDLNDILEMPFLPEEMSKYTAVKGDVLICEGGYPGRAAIWNEDYPIHFQKALHRVRFHEPDHNKWFLYYLVSQDKSGELRRHFSGTGIQHFTGQALAKFELPLPPLPELRRAVAKLDALSEETQRLESIYQKKLINFDDLKKSLLHQAFSGML